MLLPDWASEEDMARRLSMLLLSLMPEPESVPIPLTCAQLNSCRLSRGKQSSPEADAASMSSRLLGGLSSRRADHDRQQSPIIKRKHRSAPGRQGRRCARPRRDNWGL